VEVLRSNRRNIDPLYFAIYGDVVYHHGAGFRTGELSPVDRADAPEPLPLSSLPGAGPLMRLLNGRRWRRWERDVGDRHMRQSQLLYEQISAGGSDWLAELI
jgi:hypothetical protein